MKNKHKENALYEVIIPFNSGELLQTDESPYYDDCPLCVELRKKLESGEVEEVRFEEIE